jgi:hypothetical protein
MILYCQASHHANSKGKVLFPSRRVSRAHRLSESTATRKRTAVHNQSSSDEDNAVRKKPRLKVRQSEAAIDHGGDSTDGEGKPNRGDLDGDDHYDELDGGEEEQLTLELEEPESSPLTKRPTVQVRSFPMPV